MVVLHAQGQIGVDALAFNHAGTRIATGGYDGAVRVWDARTGATLFVLHGHTGTVEHVAFSPDDASIVSAGSDGTARVWGGPGVLLATLRGHTEGVSDAEFSPDGRDVVTAGADHTARIWRTDTLLLRAFDGHAGAANDAAFSPDGRRIVAADGSSPPCVGILISWPARHSAAGAMSSRPATTAPPACGTHVAAGRSPL